MQIDKQVISATNQIYNKMFSKILFMEGYFLSIFSTHISFQTCNRRSTIDIRRSPRQNGLK